MYSQSAPSKSLNKWQFGQKISISFGGSGPFIDSGFLAGGESFSSSIVNGYNIFSDGLWIYDSIGNKLNNEKLNGDFSSNSGCIMLSKDSILHIITAKDWASAIGIHHSTYKMNSNLDLTLLSSRKLAGRSGESISYVNHQNTLYTWFAFHRFNSNEIYTFLSKPSSITCCPLVNKGVHSINTDNSKAQGGIEFSSRGNFIAYCVLSQNPFIGDGIVEIYNFNNENGLMSSKTNIKDLQLPYDVEFSADEKKIYVSEFRRNFFEFDLTLEKEDSMQRHKKKLFVSNNSNNGMVNLSPTQDILFIKPDSNFIYVVKNKDIIKNESVLSRDELEVGKKKLSYGLPNFNSSYFYTPSIDFAYTEDCWEHSYAFEGRDTFDADGYKWLFRDVRNDTLDTRQGKNVMYTFPQADSLENKYEVSHIAYNANRADTVTKTLTIRPKWKNDVLGRDTFYCTGDSIKLILQAPQDMHCVHWNEEEPNLDESLGPIVDYDYFHTDSLLVDTAGTYIVKVTNKTFCQMWDTIRVTEKPNPQKPNIQRISQELESTIAAAEYRWYYEGSPKFQNEISKIQPDSNGYWQVQLVSEYGCASELSDSLYVGYASIPSIKATNAALSFNVYPNPSDGNISIKVPKQGEYNIQITDLNGKLVYSSRHNLNLSFEFEFVFAKGTYIVTLTDEEGNTGSKKQTIVN